MKQIITALLMSFLVTFCRCGNSNEITPVLPQIEASKITNNNGKTYLEVNGVPFPILGAQIRLDGLMNCDQYPVEKIEDYFAKAKELGLNCVQIPIWWNLIEPKKDAFAFEVVDKVLGYALTYGLKIELLWFSTNMCGDSFTYLTPLYIMSEPNKKLRRENEGSFWGYYGYIYSLILNDPWILERECNAVTQLFNHIRQWDMEHGNTMPVITAQIHNEPDGFNRWRIDQYNIKAKDGSPLSKDDAWKMILDAVDQVGRAVQASSYKVATRVNVTLINGTNGFQEHRAAKPLDVFNLKGIDFVSFDPYVPSITELKPEILLYKAMQGNYPLIAENKGVYLNTPSLILASVALGSGYDIYDLATSKYFMDNTSIPNEIDHGVYTWDLKEKPHTPAIRKILTGLVAAAPVAAQTKTENFMAFNVQSDYPAEKIIQTIKTEYVTIAFSTQEKAIGFAIDDGNAVYIYVTENAEIELDNATFNRVETGAFDTAGHFIPVSNHSLSAKSLTPEPGILYKVSYTNAVLQASNTISFIGK